MDIQTSMPAEPSLQQFVHLPSAHVAHRDALPTELARLIRRRHGSAVTRIPPHWQPSLGSEASAQLVQPCTPPAARTGHLHVARGEELEVAVEEGEPRLPDRWWRSRIQTDLG